MINNLRSHFQRRNPQHENDTVPHAWEREDSHWYGSSLDLARGLDVTEVASLSAAGNDRPHPPSALAGTRPAVHDAGR